MEGPATAAPAGPEQKFKIPIYFEPNRGQYAGEAPYILGGTGAGLEFFANEIALTSRLRMQLVGGRTAHIDGEAPTGGSSNYLVGSDPRKHLTEVPQYSRLRYRSVYPGIDLVVYGGIDGVEYDFVVAPGASPTEIRLRFEGAGSIAIDGEGNLQVDVGPRKLVHRKPVAYQVRGSNHVNVAASFETLEINEVTFRLGSYDPKLALIIDPVLVYATYLGGSLPRSIATDAAGNVYITGGAEAEVPNTNGTLGPGTNGLAFVLKLNPQGNAILYSTFFGGTGSGTQAHDIVINAAGEPYIAGYTWSSDFPVKDALQSTFGGFTDGYILKLNSAGNSILYGTYLGGTGDDNINGLALDAAGNMVVTGFASEPLPFPSPSRPFAGGGREAFLAKISSAGNTLMVGSYVGGAGYDTGKSVAIDSGGNIIIAGDTTSPDFPLVNPRHSARNPTTATAFVAKFNPSGSSIIFSTLIDAYEANAVAVDGTNRVYVTGSTCSRDFPVTVAGGPHFDICSAIAVSYQPDGQYAYSTTWGGGNTKGADIAADASGNVYITGDTTSADAEAWLVDPLQALLGSSQPGIASQDAFVIRLGSSGQVVFSSLLGGNHWDIGKAIAINNSGGIYLTGQTWAPLFPATPGAYRTTPQTAPDIFVAKIDLNQASCAFIATPPIARAASGAGSQTVALSTTSVCSWVIESRADWVSVTSPPRGSGSASLQFSFPANPNAQPRLGGVSLPRGGIMVLQDGTGGTCPPPAAITPNQPITGILQSGDCISLLNPSGGFADHYTFQGHGGDLVSISLTSTSFDTFLYLFGPEGRYVNSNDDIDEGSCTYFPPACNITGQSGCTRRCTGGNRNSRVPVNGVFRLPRDGTYLIEATSFNGGSTGGYVFSLDTLGTQAPGAPGPPSPANDATGVSTSPALSWSPASGATSYEVYFGSESDLLLVASTTSTSYIPGSLAAGTPYLWRIVARNAAGSTSSATWRFTTQAALSPPGAPGFPSPADSASSVATNSNLTWAPATGATSYDVYFGAAPNPPFAANVQSAGFTPPSLATGVTYFWRIVARNAAGTTSSPTWQFTTQAVLLPPGTPGSPAPPDNALSVSITPSLTWSAATGATSYDVYFGTTANPPAAATVNTPSYTPAGLSAGVTYIWRVVARNAAGAASSSTWRFTTAGSATQTGLRFVPVVPCRVADTRAGQGMTGSFGPPTPDGNTTRQLPIPSGRCGIPATAQAYSLNVTVVPAEPLGYLSLWPTGQPQPAVSTLNSFHGGVVANAAIVPAGTGGSISVFVTNRADVILDINGYFEAAGAYSFYALDPCRLADTRQGSGFAGLFGPPIPAANSVRTFPVPSGSCGVPANAAAYSLNLTVLPAVALAYLTVWPTAQTQPFVSTLNSFDGAVVANAAIVPAGAGGAVNTFVTDAAETIIDTNGYFGAAGGAGELRFFPVTPCRAADTRLAGNGAPVMAASETREFVLAGKCGVPQGAKAIAVNATVVPNGPLGFLTMWPSGKNMPLVSTLNSFLGRVVANAAIVPAGTNGGVNVFVTNQTHVILDVNGYFQ